MMQKPPPPHVSPTGMWTSKLTLRILQFCFSIAAIGVVSSILSTGVWSILILIIIIPQAGVSVIWSLSEGICILARGGHRGIHPGANVALDLLLWLGFIAGTVMLYIVGVATSLVASSSRYSSSSYYYYPTSSSSSRTRISTSTLESVAARGQALIALGSLLTILHFTTFVIACVETNIRNRMPHGQVLYVVAPGQEAQHSAMQYHHGQPMPYQPQGYAQQGQVYAPQEQGQYGQYGQYGQAGVEQLPYVHPSVKG